MVALCIFAIIDQLNTKTLDFLTSQKMLNGESCGPREPSLDRQARLHRYRPFVANGFSRMCTKHVEDSQFEKSAVVISTDVTVSDSRVDCHRHRYNMLSW